MGWGGRYSATAVMSLFILTTGLIHAFWLVPLLTLGITFLALYLFFGTFYSGEGRLYVATLSTFSLFVYIALVPTTAELFCWLAGGVSYQVGLSLFIILCTLLLRENDGEPRPGRLHFYLRLTTASILAFLVAGFNETLMVLQLAILLPGTLIHHRRGVRTRSLWITALLFASVGAVLLVSAPGNVVRATHHVAGGKTAAAVLSSISTGTLFLVTKGAVLLLLGFFLPTLQPRNEGSNRNDGRYVLALLLYPAVIVSFFPVFWVTGHPPAYRIMSLPLILLVCGVIPPALSLARVLYGTVLGEKLCRTVTAAVLTIGVVILAFLLTNFRTITGDLAGRSAHYSRLIDARYETIERERAGGARTIFLPRLHVTPASIHVTDITPDPTDWKNRCYASFFGVEEIALR